MSKKMKMPSIFKNKEANQQWQWPSCKQPKTLSFRASNDVVFKTVNSVFLDTSDGLETPESWFTNSSSECASTFSTDDHSEENNNNETVETIIRGVRSSERLFFEPNETSSLVIKEAATAKKTGDGSETLPFEESMALAFESDDPYLDFKKSIQEMVESHGLEDWDRLEELLAWYLKMNGKQNHGFIVKAFVDVLVGIVKESSPSSSMAVGCSDSTSYSSADSCFSSPSSPHSQTDAVEEEGDVNIVQS
ncbi:hypothetical protein ACS0TY_000774 [Phlomoides rotata]